MAAMNRTHSTQFLDDMIRRKESINATIALSDRRQWPALGQSAEIEHKKKLASSGKSDSAKDHITVQQSASPSHLPASERVIGSVSNGLPDVTQSDITNNRQTTSEIARKKTGKTKWIPLELPQQGPGLSLPEKMRLKRRQELGLPPMERPQFPPRFQNGHGYVQNGARISGYQSNDWHQNERYHNERRSETLIRRAPLPPPQSQLKPRPTNFSRKLYLPRNKNIMYDSDYRGREVDQRSDGTADDASVAQGFWEDGHYYHGEGTQTPVDWNTYYGYSVYPEAYEGYGYGAESYFSTPESYVPVEGNGAYQTSEYSQDVLKQMIKTQIEYYFSEENLQKDFFLRRNMSPRGSVLLSLLASFQRVQRLTQDLGLIMEAIGDSDKVEILDGMMIRSRDRPEKWPLLEDEKRRYGDHFTDTSSESDSLVCEDLSGYRLYEAGKPYLWSSDNGKASTPHTWEESESGQFDGDFGWSEEDAESDETPLEVSDGDTNFHTKISEAMDRVSLEVIV